MMMMMMMIIIIIINIRLCIINVLAHQPYDQLQGEHRNITKIYKWQTVNENIPFKAYWLREVPTSLTFNNCTLCPHCIYVFCIYLRKNSDLCHLQYKLIRFYNRNEKCLLRGTDLFFKCSSLRFVFKGLKQIIKNNIYNSINNILKENLLKYVICSWIYW